MAKRSRRSSIPILGIVLIIIGAVLLLQTMGAIPWSLWWHLWRYWPVALIAAGVGIVLGQRAPFLATVITALLLLFAVGGAAWNALAENEGAVAFNLTEPVGATKYLDLDIAFGAGTIKLGDLPADSPNLVVAEFRGPGTTGGATYSLKRTGDRATLVIGNVQRSFWRPSVKYQWDIRLARDLETKLTLQSGASDLSLNLEQLKITSLDMGVGAASVDLVVPAKVERALAAIDLGAANLNVTVPSGVAARIDTNAGLARIDVDEKRFPKTGESYVSPDYGGAQYRVALTIKGGVSSINVR